LIQLALFAARHRIHRINLGLPPGEPFQHRIRSGNEPAGLLGWVPVHNPTPTKVPTLLRPTGDVPCWRQVCVTPSRFWSPPPIGLPTGRRPLKLRASNRQVRRWSFDSARPAAEGDQRSLCRTE
jgi:hypothetical protein